MTSNPQLPRPPVRNRIVKLHRWLGLGAALFWLVQAITGTLLSFHFELEDMALSGGHRPTDPAAIERRIDSFASDGAEAGITWIWTTAGLPDRYIILFAGADGTQRKAYIDGVGDILRDRAADDYSVLALMREIHLTLAAGTLGHWLLAVSGLLLFTNLIFGIVAAWPRRGQWRTVLKPVGSTGKTAGLYSWHRAVGMWAAVPAIVIAGTGTLILFEHPLRDLARVPDITLPANPPAGPTVGFAAARQAAVEAIPGSRFVGTTFPSAQDASYYAWVRAPGELYRGGYGSSLVIVDANTGSVRGAWPATDADTGRAIIASFYPLHTGESLGTFGRILTMSVGLWLAVTIVLGTWLWFRRRSRGSAA